MGLPTATRRRTRSRQGGSKRAAHACTLRHQGLTSAVVSGRAGGGGGGGSAGSGVGQGSMGVVSGRAAVGAFGGGEGVPGERTQRPANAFCAACSAGPVAWGHQDPPPTKKMGGGAFGMCWKGGREGGRGGLKGGEGGWLGPPFSQSPPTVPAEGGPKVLKLKSSWQRRFRSKMTLAVSRKHWKGRRGGGSRRGG